MSRLSLTLLALVLTTFFAGRAVAASNGPSLLPLPRWLPGAERQALEAILGGARPVHTSYISYPRKIAVIFEFNRIVICRTCGGPSNASIPRGRVIRVSFDRHTHRLTGSMQFCESRGTNPPRALCLRR